MNETTLIIPFNGIMETIVLEQGRYSNGRLALMIYDSTRLPFCKLTINMIDEEIDCNQFFIKIDGPWGLIAAELEKQNIIRRLDKEAIVFNRVYAFLWELVDE